LIDYSPKTLVYPNKKRVWYFSDLIPTLCQSRRFIRSVCGGGIAGLYRTKLPA